MSIIKSNYGNVENVLIVEFGKGTLSLTNSSGESHKAILIRENAFSPIGEKGEFLNTSDEFDPQIALAFRNRESFEVFKEFVNNIAAEYDAENVAV